MRAVLHIAEALAWVTWNVVWWLTKGIGFGLFLGLCCLAVRLVWRGLPEPGQLPEFVSYLTGVFAGGYTAYYVLTPVFRRKETP